MKTTHDAQAENYLQEYVPTREELPADHWSLQKDAPTLASVTAELEQRAKIGMPEYEKAQRYGSDPHTITPNALQALDSRIKEAEAQDLAAYLAKLDRKVKGLPAEEPTVVDTLGPKIQALETAVIESVKKLLQYQSREFICRLVMQIEQEN
jgi:hypothetical protein